MSLGCGRLRGLTALALTVVMACLGLQPAPALAAETVTQPPATASDDGTPAAAPGPGAPPVEGTSAPQLQLQDEGPAAPTTSRMFASRAPAATNPGDERPFWKSWIFWAVTGALVVGAVSLVAYSSSHASSSVAPCPPEITLSLGCYGAGRGQ